MALALSLLLAMNVHTGKPSLGSELMRLRALKAHQTPALGLLPGRVFLGMHGSRPQMSETLFVFLFLLCRQYSLKRPILTFANSFFSRV